jgi:predicted nucleotidyltransferase
VTPETAYLRRLAERVVEAAAAQFEIQAALLAGSAGRGNADCFSDLDLLFYVWRVPTDDEVAAVREAVGGENALRRWEATDYANGEEFQLEGVRTEVSFTLVERVEWLLDQLLVELDDIASPRQKLLAGLAEGLPLYGDELIGRWQARVRAYPEPFRLEMIRRHWNFFPLWYHGEAMSLRDTELWRLDVLLEGVFNLLGVLAAINRIYFARFELKRTRDLISKMTIAPPRLADRIEALVHLPAQDAAQEFGQLVAETAELVSREVPDATVDLPFALEARQQPWRYP